MSSLVKRGGSIEDATKANEAQPHISADLRRDYAVPLVHAPAFHEQSVAWKRHHVL